MAIFMMRPLYTWVKRALRPRTGLVAVEKDLCCYSAITGICVVGRAIWHLHYMKLFDER
jgi:hypothetical protein